VPTGIGGTSLVPSGQFVSQTYPVQGFVEVPKEVVRTVEVPKYVDRVRTVEVPKIVEKEVIKYVDRIKTVEVPKEVIRTVEVPKYIDRVKTVEVPKEVVRTVEVPKYVDREVIKYVDRIKTVEVPKEVVRTQSNFTCSTQAFDLPSNSTVHITGGGVAACPSGTSQQADGSCLQATSGGWATPAPVAPTTNHNQYCYSGGSKIYDSLGHEIGSNCNH